MRHHKACAIKAGHVVAGTDPVAIDAYCVRNIVGPNASTYKEMLALDNPDSKVSRFLRYFRQAAGWGTLDEKLVTVVG
jgi:hypothetical protein